MKQSFSYSRKQVLSYSRKCNLSYLSKQAKQSIKATIYILSIILVAKDQSLFSAITFMLISFFFIYSLVINANKKANVNKR